MLLIVSGDRADTTTQVITVGVSTCILNAMDGLESRNFNFPTMSCIYIDMTRYDAP